MSQMVNDACDAQLSSAMLLALDDVVISCFIRCSENTTATDVYAFVGVLAHCLSGEQQLLGSAAQLALKLGASEFVFLLFRAAKAVGIDVNDAQWATCGITQALDVLLRSHGVLPPFDDARGAPASAYWDPLLRYLVKAAPLSVAVAGDRLSWLCGREFREDDTTVNFLTCISRFFAA